MILIVFIMKNLIVIKSLMYKMLMMINIEKLEMLENYLKSLIEIIINQKLSIEVLQEKLIIT